MAASRDWMTTHGYRFRRTMVVICALAILPCSTGSTRLAIRSTPNVMRALRQGGGSSVARLAIRSTPCMMVWPPAQQQGEIRITYCTRCGWLLRSAWLAQELLNTFGGGTDEPGEVASVALVPDASGGVFTVHVNGELIWDRAVETPSFPEAKQLKVRVRNVLCPERSLGHSDAQPLQ